VRNAHGALRECFLTRANQSLFRRLPYIMHIASVVVVALAAHLVSTSAQREAIEVVSYKSQIVQVLSVKF
jgi:hypothetical protein